MNILVGKYTYTKNIAYYPCIMGKLRVQGSRLVVGNFTYRKNSLVVYALLLVSFTYLFMKGKNRHFYPS